MSWIYKRAHSKRKPKPILRGDFLKSAVTKMSWIEFLKMNRLVVFLDDELEDLVCVQINLQRIAVAGFVIWQLAMQNDIYCKQQLLNGVVWHEATIAFAYLWGSMKLRELIWTNAETIVFGKNRRCMPFLIAKNVTY